MKQRGWQQSRHTLDNGVSVPAPAASQQTRDDLILITGNTFFCVYLGNIFVMKKAPIPAPRLIGYWRTNFPMFPGEYLQIKCLIAIRARDNFQ
ncbi:MAG: hypothetical protein A2W28_03080 [Gammaproteobacteria bacterium RBG_16_51_14]|nr:MAG: hypothetical protein A2W28_03080 [Gammaproteobacteria bacterium RBG_16_51_14]